MNRSVFEVNRHLPRLSLQEMSAIKIMSTLCNDPQVLGLILRCNFRKDIRFRMCVRNERQWKAVLALAEELVSQICKSTILKNYILEYLWPVSCRILVWKSVYAPTIANGFLQYFYWTDRGRINNAKTVRRIIGNKNIPVRIRFILGCSVCLGEELLKIWNEMSSIDKEYFLSENDEELCPLFQFWARNLKGYQDHLDESVPLVLECAVKVGMVETVKYIFAMYGANIRQRKDLLNHSVLNFYRNKFLEEDENDIAYILFFEMAEVDREIYFNYYTTVMVSLLLHSAEYEQCRALLETRLKSSSWKNILAYSELVFHKYHLEMPYHEDCGKLLVDVWRMIPTSASVVCLMKKLKMSLFLMTTLIKDNFSFVVEDNASDDIAELILLNSDKSHFIQGKWNFLILLIKEERTISLCESFRTNILRLLKKEESDMATWNRFLRFIHYIKSKNSEQN